MGTVLPRDEDRGGEEHLEDAAHRRPQPCQGAGAGRERHRQAGGRRARGAGECAGGESGGGGRARPRVPWGSAVSTSGEVEASGAPGVVGARAGPRWVFLQVPLASESLCLSSCVYSGAVREAMGLVKAIPHGATFFVLAGGEGR